MMALAFVRRAAGSPRKLGVFAAAFNPPTRAHLALAEAALEWVDEVLFVLPRVFPHKAYEGATAEQRIEMLAVVAGEEPRYSIATSERGLFAEIAGECREVYGAGARLLFVCGADAAERIIHWDYGEPGAFLRMIEGFDLLVADRGAGFEAPAEMRAHIQMLQPPEDIREISATEVRERLQRGERWEDLVPRAIVAMVRRIYRGI